MNRQRAIASAAVAAAGLAGLALLFTPVPPVPRQTAEPAAATSPDRWDFARNGMPPAWNVARGGVVDRVVLTVMGGVGVPASGATVRVSPPEAPHLAQTIVLNHFGMASFAPTSAPLVRVEVAHPTLGASSRVVTIRPEIAIQLDPVTVSEGTRLAVE